MPGALRDFTIRRPTLEDSDLAFELIVRREIADMAAETRILKICSLNGIG